MLVSLDKIKYYYYNTATATITTSIVISIIWTSKIHTVVEIRSLTIANNGSEDVAFAGPPHTFNPFGLQCLTWKNSLYYM